MSPRAVGYWQGTQAALIRPEKESEQSHQALNPVQPARSWCIPQPITSHESSRKKRRVLRASFLCTVARWLAARAQACQLGKQGPTLSSALAPTLATWAFPSLSAGGFYVAAMVSDRCNWVQTRFLWNKSRQTPFSSSLVWKHTCIFGGLPPNALETSRSCCGTSTEKVLTFNNFTAVIRHTSVCTFGTCT